MDYRDMGRRIRDLRRMKGLTQQQLARKAAISGSFLGLIERGQKAPSLETLVDLCNALGTDMNYLLALSLKKSAPGAGNNIPPEMRRKLATLLSYAQEMLKDEK